MNNLVSLQEYAQDHDITAATMRQRIQRGMHPEAVKIAKVWLIPRDAPFVDHRAKGITRRHKAVAENDQAD